MSRASPGALLELTQTFLRLGLTSFGGPVAHIGYLREACVVRRRWLTESTYADLVSLCQFLPGPASSQLVFALGVRRAGWLGGILASLCFTLPSAILMIACAYGLIAAQHLRLGGWIHGLKLAAIPIVAQAVWGMGRSLCPDPARCMLSGVAAALLLLFPHALLHVGVIVGGGIVGWLLYRKSLPRTKTPDPIDKSHIWVGTSLLGLFAALLVALPLLAANTSNKQLAVFDSIYRSGSLVFGGGHVVLPLLRAELVPKQWIGDNAFLAGYGAAQALPGPLFTFAGYLGTLIHGPPRAWLGGVFALIAIFLPAWLLIAGALPFWQQLRSQPWAQATLRGANAAVVGVLLSAFVNPVWSEGIRSVPDAILAVVTFLGLQLARLPSWAIVLLCATYGRLFHHASM